MRRIFDKAYKLTKISSCIIIALIYAICMLGYHRSIYGLEKPAGFSEALIFLFKHPGEYMLAILAGIVLHIICIVTIVAVLICIIAICMAEIEFNVAIVLNIILAIVMLVLNMCFVKYVLTLSFVLCVILGIFWLWATSD